MIPVFKSDIVSANISVQKEGSVSLLPAVVRDNSPVYILYWEDWSYDPLLV